MIKAEWGTKRQCLECGAKFYDFNKTDLVCPACEAPFDIEASIRLKRNRQQLDQETDEKPLEDEATLLDDEVEADLGSDDDEGVLEDTSDIDTDDDVPIVNMKKENDSE